MEPEKFVLRQSNCGQHIRVIQIMVSVQYFLYATMVISKSE